MLPSLPSPHVFENPEAVMRRALALAAQGEGRVEPNPMVGAVVVDDRLQLLGEGWHEVFGGPHAEVNALAAAGERARGATLYVTLEPCCHQGKTPPCTEAVIAAGIRRVVVAMQDPFPKVAGGGIRRLRETGVDVDVGLCELEARRLTAPFRTLIEKGRPYVHAKWAMTLDGKIASRTGQSKWISNAKSREVVHALRGRMDAIAVGIGTALADDPLLTARPPGPRTPLRIVFDRQARLPATSQLAATARNVSVLLFCDDSSPAEQVAALRAVGVEVQPLAPRPSSLAPALQELGRRKFTNLLVEGGGGLLGAFFDEDLIDECHVFVAPKLLGGRGAKSPILGDGKDAPPALADFGLTEVTTIDGDTYIRARRA
jgi:diaminohydroxyphosphoribosylaminopyrimidine deaminase/5-amino-6-(5-phosphoribosylamino)uracil reductase